jgi:hypothetical protein
MKKKWILAIFAFILIINLSSVLAADFLSPIMNIFKGLDLGAYVTNPQYYPFIDAVIYLILFIGISTFALGKVFGESKIVPITVGVILALSMAGFEYMTKWRLMIALSMYAWILVLLIFGFSLYYLMNKVTNNFWIPFAIAVFLVGGLLTTNEAVSEQVRQNETLSGVIGLTQTVAFIGLIGGIFSFVKFKGSGGESFLDAKNTASNDNSNWGKFASDIGKGEKDALTIGAGLDSEKQKINDLMNGELNAEQRDEYDLKNEENIITKAKEYVERLIKSKIGIENAKKLPLEQQEQQILPLEDYISQILNWLKIATPRISQFLQIDKRDEDLSIASEKTAEVEVKKLQDDITKITGDNKKIVNELIVLDKFLASKITDKLKGIEAETNSVSMIQENIKIKNSKIADNLNKSREYLRINTLRMNRVNTLLDTRLKTVTNGTRTFTDIEPTALEELSKLITEVKEYADARTQLHGEIKKELEEINTLIKTDVQTTQQSINNFNKTIHDTLSLAITESNNDINAYVTFKKIIEEYIEKAKTVPLLGRARFITECESKMVNFQIQNVSAATIKIITEYRESLTKAGEQKDPIKLFDKRAGDVRSGINNIISHEEQKIQKIKQLVGA